MCNYQSNMTKNKIIQSGIALLAIYAAMDQSAKAQLYNVNCGETGNGTTMTGAGVLGGSGDVWNAYLAGWYTYGPQNTVTIMDSTGSASAGVTVDVWNYVTGSINAGGTTANPTALMQDYITSASSGDGWPIKVQFGNLPVSTAFELVVYSAGDSAGQGATINLTDSAFSTVLTSAVTTGADRNISQGQGDAYQILAGTTDSSGNIYFDVANTANWHALNGFQLELTPTPEPSSLALVAAGGVALGMIRRRFRQ